MPRLTNQQHIIRHNELFQTWREHPESFRVLTPTEQQCLHTYYATAERLNSRQLIEHRRRLDQEKPALGFRAGKAYAKLHRFAPAVFDGVHALQRTADNAEPRQLSVSAVVRPKPDIEKLARAIRLLAEQLAEESAAQRDDSDDPLPRV